LGPRSTRWSSRAPESVTGCGAPVEGLTSASPAHSVDGHAGGLNPPHLPKPLK
jgi:hypothetical protein